MSRLGIDLGTTNTVVARDGSALEVPSESSATMPSVVAYPPNGTVQVGSSARRRRAIDATNTIYSSKRLLGRRWTSTEIKQFQKHYPFDLRERNGKPTFHTRQGAREPEDIAAILLGHVLAELAEDLSSLEAIVAVPAGFAEPHWAATLDAARRAGIANVELIAEPVATTRAYADSHQGRVAVYDLGGGTFELAIVDLSSAESAVVGMASDLYLGGDDIDRALADLIADQVLAESRWDLRDDPIVRDHLILTAEAAKVALGAASEVVVDIGAIDPAVPGGPRSVVVTREQLESVAEPILRRTFLLCDQALAAAQVAAKDLDAVLLAGGTSLMPLVERTVTQYFDQPPVKTINPTHVVAVGASR